MRHRQYSSPYKTYGLVSVVMIVSGIGVLWYCTQWHVFIVYICVINSVTILLYLWDKCIAASRMVRVPEMTLHALAFAGGSPAALLGQTFFRHKTQKTGFLIWFWMIVLVQGLALGWLVYTHSF